MRAILATASILLASLTVLPAADAQSGGGLRIAEVLPAPASGDREFVELWNSGNSSIDLTGWRMVDAADNTYTFGVHSVAPDGRIVLWSGGTSDALGPAWSNSVVWNNAGDEVRLVDDAGTVVDRFAYGGHENATVAAPPTGVSLSLLGGTWQEGDPTPGFVATASGGDLAVTVQNVPPMAEITNAPGRVLVGEEILLSFNVSDANGDLAAWRVEEGGTVLAQGTDPGAHVVNLTAPQAPGVWALSVVAEDGAGQQDQADVAIQVATSHIEVTLPANGTLRFPDLAPGDADVAALQTFTVRNLGDSAQTPVIDISPFAGPGNATIPVDGNLHIEVLDPAGGPSTFVDYDGPLTDLPSLQPEEEREIRLHVAAVPLPLAAGEYGTSFTVTG